MDFADVPTVQLVALVRGLHLILERESEHPLDIVRAADYMWVTLAVLLRERAANGDFRAVDALGEIGGGW